jgi:hypothetical protein
MWLDQQLYQLTFQLEHNIFDFIINDELLFEEYAKNSDQVKHRHEQEKDRVGYIWKKAVLIYRNEESEQTQKDGQSVVNKLEVVLP